MIKKENFVKIMDSLRTQYEQSLEFGRDMSKYLDGHFTVALNEGIYDQVFKALSDEMNLDDVDLMNWWAWELDFGRVEVDAWAMIREKRFDISDAGKFYDFLCS